VTSAENPERPRVAEGGRTLRSGYTAFASQLKDRSSHLGRVARGASVAFVLRAAAALCQFLLGVYISRRLGPSGAGVFFLALTVLQVGVLFGRFGLDNTVLRLVASHGSSGEWDFVHGSYGQAMRIAIVASLGVCAVTIAAAGVIATQVLHKPEVASAIRIIAIAVVPTVLLTLNGEALKGLRRIAQSQWIQGPAVPLISLLIFAIGVHGSDLRAALWSQVTAAFAVLVWALLLWRRLAPHAPGRAVKVIPIRAILNSSVPLFWSASLTLAMGWVSTIVLSRWGTTADVGIFSAASRTALLTSVMLTSVNSIAAPTFASLWRAGNMVELERTARGAGLLMTVLAAPVFLVFVIAPHQVLHLFGDKFEAGAPALVILSAGQLINVATGSVSYLLMMSGNERAIRNSITVVLVGSVLLNIALVPRLGVLGAAIATATGVAAVNVINAVQVRRLLKISSVALWPRRRSVSAALMEGGDASVDGLL
jgi:O-antigen/teichoic acid export membrane protein